RTGDLLAASQTLSQLSYGPGRLRIVAARAETRSAPQAAPLVVAAANSTASWPSAPTPSNRCHRWSRLQGSGHGGDDRGSCGEAPPEPRRARPGARARALRAPPSAAPVAAGGSRRARDRGGRRCARADDRRQRRRAGPRARTGARAAAAVRPRGADRVGRRAGAVESLVRPARSHRAPGDDADPRAGAVPRRRLPAGEL